MSASPMPEARDHDRAQLSPEPSRLSVVLDVCGGAWQRQGDLWYTATSNELMTEGRTWPAVNFIFGPLTLIYEHEAGEIAGGGAR